MPRLGAIELNQLPTMQILETLDSDANITARIKKLVEYWAVNDPPNAAQYDVGGTEFDPIKINQETNAYFELTVRDRVNQAAKAVTLAFASGTDLDAIGSRYPGGMPRLPNESDDDYRTRVWLSPNTLTQNGVYESYVFFALTAARAAGTPLRDCQVVSTPGNPHIKIVIMADGTPVTSNGDGTFTPFPSPIPANGQILTVRDYITAPGMARKGLTDVITVVGPRVVTVNYDIDVFLFPGWDQTLTMKQLYTAIAKLVEKQRYLGFSHTHAAIEAALEVGGVFDVRVNSPAQSVIIAADQVVVVNSIIVRYAGRGGIAPLPPTT